MKLACLLTPLALLHCLAPATVASPLEAPTRTWRLRNGVPVTLVRNATPPTLAVRVAAGRALDPPGREGLAELTARTLTSSTGAHRLPGEVAGALLAVTDGASIEVDDQAAILLLSGLKDTRGALELSLAILSTASFSPAAFDDARRSFALELVDARTETDRHVSLARALASPTCPPSPWSVAGLDRSDAVDFHRRHYGIDGSSLALSGRFTESDEDLLTALQRSYGTWLNRSEPAEPQEDPTCRGDSALLLRGPGGPALALAWAPLQAQRPGSVLLALRLAAGDAFMVEAGGSSLAGEICRDTRSVLLASAAGRPERLERRLDRRLDHLARHPPAPTELSRLREQMVSDTLTDETALAALDCATLPEADEGEPPFVVVERLLRALSPADVAAAARALSDAPRVACARADENEAAFGWRQEHPELVEVGRGQTARHAEASAELEGPRIWRDVVRAHGGLALEQFRAFTLVSEKGMSNEKGSAPIGTMRLDVNGRLGQLRQEARRGKSIAGISLAVLDGDRALTQTMLGAEPLERSGVVSLQQELRHMPPILLGGSPRLARSRSLPEGGTWLELLRESGDATLVELDDATGLIHGIRFRSRVPNDIEREIRLEWSDYRPTRGALLPWLWQRHSWPRLADLDIVVDDKVTDWSVRQPDFPAAGLRTDPEDLRKERPSAER